MSEFTDEHARDFYATIHDREPDDAIERKSFARCGRLMLSRLAKSDWELTLPLYRFSVDEYSDRLVFVHDNIEDRDVRTFHATESEPYDDTVAAAQAEAERLNRGVGQ